MAKILEIEELQKAQTYLKSTESIFVISYSPKGWSYSPYANANSGLNYNSRLISYCRHRTLCGKASPLEKSRVLPALSANSRSFSSARRGVKALPGLPG